MDKSAGLKANFLALVRDKPARTLVALALAAGLAWRAELEMRGGWPGLTWIGYFHFAIPVFVGAFIFWSTVVAPVRRRAWFGCVLAALACVGAGASWLAIYLRNIGGPNGLIFLINLGGGPDGDFALGMRRFKMLFWLSYGVWPLIPLSFCVCCRHFGVAVTWRRAALSAALFVASWPLAVAVRWCVGLVVVVPGYHDLIHALKSGYVIPFLMLSLGLPLLPWPSPLMAKPNYPSG
jgi:hypothetical protein